MSEKIRYTDEPLGDPKVVPDFLPRPERNAVELKGPPHPAAASR